MTKELIIQQTIRLTRENRCKMLGNMQGILKYLTSNSLILSGLIKSSINNVSSLRREAIPPILQFKIILHRQLNQKSTPLPYFTF
jgi:hypothetical protein